MEIYKEGNKNALNIGLSCLNVVSRMRLSLPLRIPFNKNYRIIKVSKFQIADFIESNWGFTKIYGVDDVMLIQYNSWSKLNEVNN